VLSAFSSSAVAFGQVDNADQICGKYVISLSLTTAALDVAVTAAETTSEAPKPT
jgi:hypothetical protein